jgi:GTP-binding protein HflX
MIDTEKDNKKLVERAILIGVQELGVSTDECDEHMKELKELVKTMGVPVIDDLTIKMRKPSSRFFLGSGKAEEINDLVKRQSADCLIFDCDLSPSQQRNWEKLTKICVIDRQEVILDIFAGRASTREAVLQVELARMQYSLPRLTRAWTHLSRQQGGAKGTRGEGEKQIEVDRRLVQKKITQLRKELEVVVKQRLTQRKKRERNAIPHAAIVGYTNAGKSSLLNVLSGSDVLVEDKLFATLDPTTRRITLPNGNDMLLTDTVGFVRKLPHTLVQAFKSTLEEAVLADFIILVLDASNPYMEDHRCTTLAVLEELGAEDREIVTVINKVDLLENDIIKSCLQAKYTDSGFISTITGEGCDEFKTILEKITEESNERIQLAIPPARHDIIAQIHKAGRVVTIKYEEDGTAAVTAVISKANQSPFLPFLLA